MKNDFSQQIKDAIKGGINSSFWKEGLKKILDDDIITLTDRIVGDTKEDLTDEQRNHLIDLRKIYRNIVELPERILGEKEENPPPQSSDPYE